MPVALSQSVTFAIGNESSDGAPANASSIAGTLYRNGASTAETVTITNLATGIYSVAFTVPSGWVVADLLQVRVVADGIGRFVWGDSIDVTVNSVSTIASNTYAVVQLTDSDVAAIDSKIGTPAGASLAADVAAVKSDTGTLVSRVTSTVATLWANLTAMITGSGVAAKFTATALQHAPTGGGGGGDAEQATLLLVEDKVDSIAVALAGSSPVEPTGTNIRDQLQEIYDGLFPADPDTDPVVITPGTGDITTGWMVCLDETGEAEQDVSVYCQMSDVPSSETGFAHSSRIQTATSAANGVVEFSLVKGASYFFWRGKASPNGTLDPVAIPSEAGSTYELPSIRAIV